MSATAKTSSWEATRLRLTYPYRKWEQHSQNFELKWWREHPPPALAGARETSRRMLQRLGFPAPDYFSRKTVIDIGCGPTGRLSWFNAGSFIAVDPLLTDYKLLRTVRLEPYTNFHEVPAEHRIHELEGIADAVLCINALDHGYDFCAAIVNIRSYLKPGGLFLLSLGVDNPHPPDHTHPIRVTHDYVTTFLQAAGFRVDRIAHGHAYPLGDDKWDDTYSGAPAFHWWSTKTDA